MRLLRDNPDNIDFAGVAEESRLMEPVTPGEIPRGHAWYFSTTPQIWMNLQKIYALEVARGATGQTIKDEVQPRIA